MKCQPVLTKKDYFVRWVNDEFGNRLRAWNTHADLMSSGYSGCVSIRFAQSCVYDVQHYVPVDQVLARITEKKWDITNCRFNESPNDDKLIFQGELMRGTRGLYVLYSTEKLPMRKALEACSKVAWGVSALVMLQHWMCPSSYADLEALLDSYPDHVIEFSTFAYNLGNIPNRNTIIWEVRKY